MIFSTFFHKPSKKFDKSTIVQHETLARWKSTNLILNLMNYVHNIYKLDIFHHFWAHFFLFQINMTAFPYESKTCQNFWHLFINQLFVLFHLVGVPCWTIVDLLNFLDSLWRKIEKMPKILMNMSSYMIPLSSDLISDFRFEFLGWII